MNLDIRYKVDDSIVARQIAGEFILVPIRQSAGEVESIYTLNEVGTRIWQLLDGERSLTEIRDTLVAEFAVGQAEAEADLVEFIQGLDSVGAIQKA